jgi:hypothetical protein
MSRTYSYDDRSYFYVAHPDREGAPEGPEDDGRRWADIEFMERTPRRSSESWPIRLREPPCGDYRLVTL